MQYDTRHESRTHRLYRPRGSEKRRAVSAELMAYMSLIDVSVSACGPLPVQADASAPGKSPILAALEAVAGSGYTSLATPARPIKRSAQP